MPTGDVAKRMPLYPVCIAAVYWWQSQELWGFAFLVLQTFIGWCGTVLIALTAARLGGARAGLLAGLITAFYSPYRFLQMVFLTETLVIFFLTLALFIYVAVVLERRPRGTRSTALVGVSLLIGLAVLTRANAALFILPFAIDAASRSGAIRERLLRVGLLLTPMAVCATAWGFRNYSAIGRFTLSTSGGLNLYLGHNPGYAESPDLAQADYAMFDRLRAEHGLSEAETDRRLSSMAWNYFAAHPRQTLVNTGYKLAVWLQPTVTLSAPTLVLLGIGTLASCSLHGGRLRGSSGMRRLLLLTAFAFFLPCAVLWLIMLVQTKQPWTSPLEVVPLGLVALALMRSRPQVRGLLAGLFLSQTLVGLAMIPLARLRWTVDGILIIALAVGIANLCEWMVGTSEKQVKSGRAVNGREV